MARLTGGGCSVRLAMDSASPLQPSPSHAVAVAVAVGAAPLSLYK
jgi:hypothetical protein